MLGYTPKFVKPISCWDIQQHISILVHFSHLPAYEDGTECSETSAYKIQALGNYPEESIKHSKHSESLNSIMCLFSRNISL